MPGTSFMIRSVRFSSGRVPEASFVDGASEGVDLAGPDALMACALKPEADPADAREEVHESESTHDHECRSRSDKLQALPLDACAPAAVESSSAQG